jgi:hypothetical protein
MKIYEREDKMTNLEIHRKLAEAMNIFDRMEEEFTRDGRPMVMVSRLDDPMFVQEFRPIKSMSDAWRVAEYFDLHTLLKHVTMDGYRKQIMWLAIIPLPHNWCIRVEEKTAQLAICKAALEAIEYLLKLK